MVILRSQNKITDFLMILAWASPFKVAVITSPLAKITFVVSEITFNVAVITSSVVKITFVVAEITFEVSVMTYSIGNTGISSLYLA